MSDAHEIARQTTELSAEDIYSLPPYQVYAKIPMFGNHYKWISGQTNPLSLATRDGSKIFLNSLLKYGAPLEEVERELIELSLTKKQPTAQQSTDFSQNLGRRKKGNA